MTEWEQDRKGQGAGNNSMGSETAATSFPGSLARKRHPGNEAGTAG